MFFSSTANGSLYWNEQSGVECSYRGKWTNTVRCFLVHHFSSQTIISTWALKGLNQYNKTAMWQNFRNSHSLKSEARSTLWYSSNWKNLENVRDSRIHAQEIWREHVCTGSQRGKILWVSWPSVSKKKFQKSSWVKREPERHSWLQCRVSRDFCVEEEQMPLPAVAKPWTAPQPETLAVNPNHSMFL